MKKFKHFLSILILISLIMSTVSCAVAENGSDTESDTNKVSEENYSTQDSTDDYTDTSNGDEESVEDDTDKDNQSDENLSESTQTDEAVKQLLKSRHTLRFDENGQFTVLIFADLHLKSSGLPPYIKNCIQTLVDREDPDLIILTGDNVADSSINSDIVFKKTLHNAMEYVESKGIPWMHVYGNHDSEGSYTREQQQRVYESFGYCVSKAGDDLTGVGNYVLPVYASDSDEVKFTVWGLDSGDYMSAEDKAKLCPVTSTFGGYSGTNYDYIHGDQIDWYVRSSKLLEEYNGGKVIPGLMAFHIPLQETYTAWMNRSGLEWTGEKRDPICASAYNSGLFGAMMTRGDIKAVVNGHDHINDFMVEYGGIKLCYSSNFSTNTYNNEDMHGARVFVINENDPSNIETYMSYIVERPESSEFENIESGYVYDFEGEAPEFQLSSWPNDVSEEAHIEQIKADIIEGVGIDGSAALGIKRTVFHDSSRGKNIEVKWDIEDPGLLGDNKYLMVWIDLETNDLDFRKACFGLLANYANAAPYATDNHDTPSVFYYKADGSDTWQTLYTGKDGCIGASDNSSVDGFKGWFAFPIEYMIRRDGTTKLDSNSIITGFYFYLSFNDAQNTNKYVYVDEFTLVEDYH